MCSRFSAIDQQSGAGLKRHCASDNPAVTARTRPRVWLKYCRAWSSSVDSRVVILLSFADTTREFAEIDRDIAIFRGRREHGADWWCAGLNAGRRSAALRRQVLVEELEGARPG